MSYFEKIKKRFLSSEEVKASTAYVLCSTLQRCLSFITLPLFTRLLTPDEYGISTVYTSTMAVAIVFTSLNLPFGSFSPAMMRFEKDRDGYISAVNAICSFLTVGYFIVYLLFRDFWNGLLDLPTELMILMGFEMLFNTAIQFWMAKARFEYSYKSFVAVTLLLSVAGTACSVIAVLFLPNKGVFKVIANGIVICAVGLVIMLGSFTKGRKPFNREYWKYALSFNIPLVPYYLSQIIFNQSDRLMINSMIGRSDAAMYGVAYSLALILTFVLNAANNSYVPWMYKKIRENEFRNNKRVSAIIAVILAGLLLGVIAFAPEIILVMAGSSYTAAVWVVPPVSMSLLLLFYSQLFINIEFYFEEKYRLVGASILAAAVNVVLNYFGIKMFGFVAAGYTTFISYILFAICNFLTMRKVCREKELRSDMYDYRFLLGLFVVFSMIGFCFMALYPFRWIRLGIIAAGTVAVMAFRKPLFEIIKRIKD
ncbi:MAG: oligosaccharide flippase family protein [Lachnospiraceae bacterium]|nr:oligosaccharide flippase family protein [Lachnospiraceae bacterium]